MLNNMDKRYCLIIKRKNYTAARPYCNPIPASEPESPVLLTYDLSSWRKPRPQFVMLIIIRRKKTYPPLVSNSPKNLICQTP